jgi:SAM-dependent methyltransferase
MANYLGDYGRVIGFDLSRIALEYCSLRRLQSLACASVENLPFASESFDLVTSFDVLYEQGVLSDSLAITEFFRVLVRGGRLLIRLPAYDWLRGRHDRIVLTARRYVSLQVTRLLQDNGFFVEHVSYANMFLFPAALIKRLMERILPSKNGVSDLSFDVGRFNGLLKAVLSSEAPWVVRTGLPFGLSVFAVGRKM